MKRMTDEEFVRLLDTGSLATSFFAVTREAERARAREARLEAALLDIAGKTGWLHSRDTLMQVAAKALEDE